MKKSRGFTLVEVLIVLVIIAMVSVLGVSTVTNTFRSKSRELSWRMASTVKYLYNSAITENRTIRLVLDFDSNSYWAEGTSDRFLLESAEDNEKRNRRGKEAKKDEDKKADKVGPDTAESALNAEGTKKEASAIEPIEPSFGSIETPLIETRQIPSGIFLKDVYTSHDKEPVVGGRAYIYFFQNGSAEEAVINFRDEADERHFSIRIDPFNGSTTIEPEYRSLEQKGR